MIPYFVHFISWLGKYLVLNQEPPQQKLWKEVNQDGGESILCWIKAANRNRLLKETEDISAQGDGAFDSIDRCPTLPLSPLHGEINNIPEKQLRELIKVRARPT